MEISTNPIQYMMSEMQSVMSAQPFSGLASSLGAGQDVPGSSASSTGTSASTVNPAATPSSQMSPDLLSSLIAAQAALTGLGGAGQHHRHHGLDTTSPTNNAPTTNGQAVASADDSDSASDSGTSAPARASATSAG